MSQSEFIGLTVVCTLYSPPQGKVRGVVADLQDGTLSLVNVVWLASGRRTPQFTIPNSNLADLEVEVDNTVATHTTDTLDGNVLRSTDTHLIRDGSEQPHGSRITTEPSGPFVDPAILSYGKPPAYGHASVVLPKSGMRPAEEAHLIVEAGTRNSPPPSSKHDVSPMQYQPATVGAMKSRVSSLTSATLSAPFLDLSQRDKSNRNNGVGTRSGVRDDKMVTESKLEEGKQGRRTATSKRKGKRAKELQESPVLEFRESSAPQKKQGPRRHPAGAGNNKLARAKEALNGWETADATDVQELGEFDFAANHAKFDKRTIFRQLREDDETAEESLLVSHNRRPKPGTAGGRNLHWSENVVESPKPEADGMGKWNSEADSDREPRSSSRASSKMRSRRMIPSRRNSNKPTYDQLMDTLTAIHQIGSGSRRQSSFEVAGSTSSRAQRQPSSPFLPVRPGSARNSISKVQLRILETKKPCPLLTPLQSLELESYVTTEHGLSDIIISENAARGIAEVAAKLVSLKQTKPFSASKRPPTVLILSSNTKTGARALAAARHLRNHGIRCTATIMGHSRHDDEDLLHSVREQASAFTNTGGKIVKPDECSGSVGETDQYALVIDAMLTTHLTWGDLGSRESAWLYELLLKLRSRDPSRILAVDVPSGLDPVTGEPTIVEDKPLFVDAGNVVSLGAGRPWAVNESARDPERDRKLWVCDVGIGEKAWRKRGRGGGIDWSDKWVLEVEITE